MKQIPLNHGKFALVDDSDYEWLMQWKWFFEQGYARRNNLANLAGEPLRMHRLILGDKLKPGMVCDHINRDKLDNRRENLRVCTRAENCQNRTKSKGTTSIYLGVTFQKGKWVTSLHVGREATYVGSFTSEVDAAIAYNRASLAANRAFATLNPVIDDGRVLRRSEHKIGKSNLRGVRQVNKRWVARASSNGRLIHLGTFDTPDDAYAARLLAEQRQ